jgi:hypothetical protein
MKNHYVIPGSFYYVMDTSMPFQRVWCDSPIQNEWIHTQNARGAWTTLKMHFFL